MVIFILPGRKTGEGGGEGLTGFIDGFINVS